MTVASVFEALAENTLVQVSDLPFPLHGTSPGAPSTPSLLILCMPILSFRGAVARREDLVGASLPPPNTQFFFSAREVSDNDGLCG